MDAQILITLKISDKIQDGQLNLNFIWTIIFFQSKYIPNIIVLQFLAIFGTFSH